jgi:hypothetical protein
MLLISFLRIWAFSTTYLHAADKKSCRKTAAFFVDIISAAIMNSTLHAADEQGGHFTSFFLPVFGLGTVDFFVTLFSGTFISIVYRTFEVFDAAAKPFSDFRQFAGAEYNEDYYQNNNQFGHSDTKHMFSLSI